MMKDTVLLKLAQVLSVDQILTEDMLTDRYAHIWTMDKPLTAGLMLLPDSTAQVSAILRICYDHDQPVVIHGGLTNLVGSTRAEAHEIVISMERLNHIIEIDPRSRTLTAESGVILEAAQEAVAAHDLSLPMRFGARGTAQLGGIAATNAGGMRVFRFGMMRSLILGLEIVQADGTIIDATKKIIKDNTGLDIKQLYIGTEGTLGVITKVVVRLYEAPQSRMLALASLRTYDDVLGLLRFMDRQMGGKLSAFELMWDSTYRALTSPPSTPKSPLAYGQNYYVLMEALGPDPSSDQQQWLQMLEEVQQQGIVHDLIPAMTQAEIQWLWMIREDVGPMTSTCPHAQHFDISLPTTEIGNYVAQVHQAMDRISDIACFQTFGHVADGNVHFIVGKSSADPGLTHRINELVYAPLRALRGSISAEHGIGRDKMAYLPYTRSEAEINLMYAIKQVLDPKHILNRGRLFTYETD